MYNLNNIFILNDRKKNLSNKKAIMTVEKGV